jgi:DNA helicase II / ATP-dependent DNA helicase PcrA
MTTAALKEIRWSPFQEAVFNFVEKETGSAVVEAVAGSGKTTTIVEAARRLPFDTEGIFLAFNKAIADELKRRLPASVPALTLNALGNRAWKNFVGKFTELDSYKVSSLVRDMTNNNDRDFVADVRKLVELAKGNGVVPGNVLHTSFGDATGIVADTDAFWQDMMDEHDIDFKFESQKRDGILLVRRVLAASIKQSLEKIDFNDQLYLPVIFNAPFNKYDLMFVDEAQDVNSIQLTMIQRSLRPKTGRLIAVGDPHQAIYGFRGAGIDSLDIIRQKFNAISLPLHVSYRCPIEVVKRARNYVPHILHREDAPAGSIKYWGPTWSTDDFKPTDIILCRNNAPLITMAFRLIRGGVGVKVLGRDIGRGLVTLVQKLKPTDTNDLRRKLMDYLAKETKKLAGKPDQISRLEDRVATLNVFADALPPLANITALLDQITTLFSSDDTTNKQLLTLSTVHKSKGGEWPRVFILKSDLMPAPWVSPGTWQYEQEVHLQYVAVTRAQEELIYIEMVD